MANLELTFGVLGNLISLFVFLAPVPTFIRIYREKSTMGFQSIPYIVALFSSTLWIYYALLKQNMLLISINAVGCVIETVYISMYLFYATHEARARTAKLVLAVNVVLFSTILAVTYFASRGGVRLLYVGWISISFSIGVFIAPLWSMVEVVRTQSVEFMPIHLSLALTVSAVVWFAYGLFKRDLLIALPNVLGFSCGLLQIVLYGIYRNRQLRRT